MERKILDAGKKAAKELAPDPAHHTPEAPIISEEEAQLVEDPDSHGPDIPVAGKEPHEDAEGSIRITPDDKH